MSKFPRYVELSTEYMKKSSESPNPIKYEEHMERWLQWRKAEEEILLTMIDERTESPIEKIVYLTLLEWGRGSLPSCPGIWPQKEIGSYRVDFYIEYAQKKIVIECDGHEFHEKTKSQAAKDKKRDRYLTSLGYTVLRYTGSEICKKPWQVIRDIEVTTDEDIADLIRDREKK